MILPQNISLTPRGPKCKHDSFWSIFISFQNILTFKLPFGANRGYWWFKKLLFTGNSFTDFRQNSAVFAPKWPIEHANRVWNIRNDNLWHLTWEDSQGFKILVKIKWFYIFSNIRRFFNKILWFSPEISP